MPLTLTNLVLVLLTLMSALASVLAGRWLRAELASAGAPAPVASAGAPATVGSAGASAPVGSVGAAAPSPGGGAGRQTPARGAAAWPTALVAAIGAGALGLLAYRWRVLGGGDLLHAHVDGLLLIASLLAGVVVYLRTRPRLAGVGTFALPLLTLLLLWAVCASAWTYRPFKLATLHPVWRGVHLGCVYLGTLSAALAAGAGAAYLVFARRMKRRADPRGAGRVASLEAVEAVIVRAATLGFALLTAGLVSGGVIMRAADGGLALVSPKVLLSAGAWATFAVVMNVRFATAFRGKRAAWLAIAGFVLLLGVYGVVTAGSAAGPAAGSAGPVRAEAAGGAAL